MAYKVYLVYPDGSKKLKASTRLYETAERNVDYYERFVARGGFTTAPNGERVDVSKCDVIVEEE
jgi:hypothetical protein